MRTSASQTTFQALNRAREAWRARAADLQMARLRERAEIGERATIPPGSRVGAKVSIGHDTRFNGPFVIKGGGGGSIGSWCAVGEGLVAVTSDHTLGRANVQIALEQRLGLGNTLETGRGIELGSAIWIGDRVTILAGARVGHGAVLGAGAVVTAAHPIPDFALAVGVPARPRKLRFNDDMIACLLDIAWWDWPYARVLRNGNFLAADLRQLAPSEVYGLVRE